MLLRKYLEKIKEGTSINYEQFLMKLPDKYRTSATMLFKVELKSTKPKKWAVKCDPKVLSELWELSEKPEDRVQATGLGNSHNFRVSANLVMVYHQELTNLCPSVVYVSKHEIIQPFTNKPVLLLIENEENFVQFNSFCSSLSLLTGKQLNIDNVDVALGGGNRATSNLLIEWYSQYDDVLCAFDYDLGGLQMFTTLKKSLGGKANFLQPLSYNSVSSLFVKIPDSSKKLQDAIKLADQLGFEKLSNVFFKTRHFMEQEQLLKERNA